MWILPCACMEHQKEFTLHAESYISLKLDCPLCWILGSAGLILPTRCNTSLPSLCGCPGVSLVDFTLQVLFGLFTSETS